MELDTEVLNMDLAEPVEKAAALHVDGKKSEILLRILWHFLPFPTINFTIKQLKEANANLIGEKFISWELRSVPGTMAFFFVLSLKSHLGSFDGKIFNVPNIMDLELSGYRVFQLGKPQRL